MSSRICFFITFGLFFFFFFFLIHIAFLSFCVVGRQQCPGWSQEVEQEKNRVQVIIRRDWKKLAGPSRQQSGRQARTQKGWGGRMEGTIQSNRISLHTHTHIHIDMRKKESDPFFFLPLFLFNVVHLLRPLAGPTGPFFFPPPLRHRKNFLCCQHDVQQQTTHAEIRSLSNADSRSALSLGLALIIAMTSFHIIPRFCSAPTRRFFFFFFIRDSHVGNPEIIG